MSRTSYTDADRAARRRQRRARYMREYRRRYPARTLRQRLRDAESLLRKHGYEVTGTGDGQLDVHTDQEHGDGDCGDE